MSNYFLNVGPDPAGKFHPTAIDYLSKIGAWVNANSEAVHGVSKSPFGEKPDWGYVTAREGKVYLIVEQWPADGAPLKVPGLKNKCLGAHMPAAPACPLKVDVTADPWLITGGAPTGGAFDVIVLTVDGRPEASH